VTIPAEPQEVGDATRGAQILFNGSFMSCGVPAKLYDNPLTSNLVRGTLGVDGELNVPGREGRNAMLPHTVNAFTTSDGAEVINRNCLGCHSGKFDGELVIGLGNALADFTGGLANGNTGAPIPDVLLAQLGLSDAEKTNFNKVLRVGRVFGANQVMRTIGQNPAEAFTGVLLSHHDPITLAWSDEPLKAVIYHDGKGGTTALVARQEEARALLQWHGARRPSRHDGARHGNVCRRHRRSRARRRSVQGHAGVRRHPNGARLQAVHRRHARRPWKNGLRGDVRRLPRYLRRGGYQ
jgi:hypothetical protein